MSTDTTEVQALREEIERLQENYVGASEFWKSLLRQHNVPFSSHEEPWYDEVRARLAARHVRHRKRQSEAADAAYYQAHKDEPGEWAEVPAP